jgi:serine-type D-Ala-D-Ala carboxypeptidase/endopeptidase (penicillin-binding protein 4)
VIRRCVVLSLALACPAAGQTPAPRGAEVRMLAAEVEAALTAPALGGADFGVLVVSLDRRDTLVSIGADRPLTPASNLKLFSTAAALRYLGPDFRWSTYLVADGEVQDGVLRGDLVIYGTGDPTLGSPRFATTRTVFDALADSVRVRGITSVRGSVVADGSFFDPQQRAAGWTPDDARFWYGASVAALSAAENTVTPGGRPVPDPLVAAGGRLSAALRASGVQVSGEVLTLRSPIGGATRFHRPRGGTASGGRVLAVYRSPELREVARVTNHVSHNLFADALLRTVARVVSGEGSFAQGDRVVNRMITELDDQAGMARLHDGSGLSRLDRVTPRGVVALLAGMDASGERAAFRGSLPAAAVPEGLERRMIGTRAAANLRAKTGTLRGVSALGGYVTAANGERLAFSIIINGAPVTSSAKRAEDRVGAALAEFTRP